MKNIIRSIAAAAALACLVPVASAATAITLKFDNLPPPDLAFFDDPYYGFNFGNNDPFTNDWFYSKEFQPPFTPVSGSTTVATDFQLYPPNAKFAESSGITYLNDQRFKFRNAWLSGYARNADNTKAKVQFNLYYNGNLVHRSAITNISSVPRSLASGYTGWVDMVTVSGPQGYFVMDNFRAVVEGAIQPMAAPVPEPSTYAMLGLGLAAVGVVAARRRKQA
jgi:hypothetical protein